TGSKLANHLMIDSLTLSLFSFQRAFCPSLLRRLFYLIIPPGLLQEVFFKNLVPLSGDNSILYQTIPKK
ncbi:hypothetical protein, partial [Brevibacillus sp. 179-C9.3 HS]|uniref:hypothetical protein n=1 Tax=unclassified Brevibacillus TaxID=2684853 RepID=UPI0039A2BDCE